jgi:hypothetical protein
MKAVGVMRRAAAAAIARFAATLPAASAGSDAPRCALARVPTASTVAARRYAAARNQVSPGAVAAGDATVKAGAAPGKSTRATKRQRAPTKTEKPKAVGQKAPQNWKAKGEGMGLEQPSADAVELLARVWKLTESTVRQAFADALSQLGTTDYGVVFLLAKDVAATQMDFERLLNPPDEEWQARRDRLNRLVRLEGDRTFDSTPEGWQTLEDFRAAVPGWKDKDIFHLRRGLPLPQRCQLSGLCYMHAPEVLQHYLVSLNNPRHTGMIDMVNLIRQNFSAKKLKEHVFDDDGDNSIRTLAMILEPASTFVSTNQAEYAKYLHKYGPALVQPFTVHTDFLEGGRWSFDGAPKGKVEGQHAMVLIGARREATSGKHFFLLQNWWKHSQFVEVSGTYLTNCGPLSVDFVETPQRRIPRKFPTQPHLVAENFNVDKPVQLKFDPLPPPKEIA